MVVSSVLCCCIVYEYEEDLDGDRHLRQCWEVREYRDVIENQLVVTMGGPTVQRLCITFSQA